MPTDYFTMPAAQSKMTVIGAVVWLFMRSLTLRHYQEGAANAKKCRRTTTLSG